MGRGPGAAGGTTGPPESAQAAPGAAVKAWTRAQTPWGDRREHGLAMIIGTPTSRPSALAKALFRRGAREKESNWPDRPKTTSRICRRQARAGVNPPGHWGERARRPCKQTSLVVDPPNGRVPDVLPEARTRPVGEGAGNGTPKAESWTDFSYYIRCITRGVTGSIFPVIYGNGQQIVQAPGFVTILRKWSTKRACHPDGRPSQAPVRTSALTWASARTLALRVVETTNFYQTKPELA
jgi:hypothetical protein